MFLLLFPAWSMLFFAAICLGGFYGFLRAGKHIRNTNTGTTPAGTLLMAFGSIAGLFGGWLLMLLSEAQGFTDGIVNQGALVGFMFVGTLVTAFGSFTLIRMIRLVHFSSTSNKNSN